MGRALHNALHRPTRRSYKGAMACSVVALLAASAPHAVRIGVEIGLNI